MINTKKCSKCLIYKEIEAFAFANKNLGKRSSSCRDCKKKYLNDYYKNNENRKQSIVLKNRQAIKENSTKVEDYLFTHPCVDCGETDPIVLEFDHVLGDKRFAISARRYSACRWELLESEIEKCEVRCANCHRRKTHQRKNNKFIVD